jgi:hypothetical protein
MKKIILLIAMFFSFYLMVFADPNPQCQALTKKGVQCKLHTTSVNGLCHLHGGTAVKAGTANTTQCTAICKSTGQQCKHRTSNQSGLCFVHTQK